MRRSRVLSTVLLAATAVATVATTQLDPDQLAFAAPVYVSNADTAAAEPSIRVDATDANERIWIAAPSGLGASTKLASFGGDVFWYSDDDGATWNIEEGLLGTPTTTGGGDSDIATGPDGQIYVTGLTLANITLAATEDDGETWLSNSVSNLGAVEDRQWIDTWEDTPKPGPLAPDMILAYGGVGERRVWLHQVFAPAGAPPVAGPRLDVSHPDCGADGLLNDACYQWPGNTVIDEATGDVYVTHQTGGSGGGDDIVVARVAGAANGPVTQLDVTPSIAATTTGDSFDSFTVVATDAASNVYVVWSESFADRDVTETRLAISHDQGATWEGPYTVNQSPATTVFPWIVAGDDGRIGIAYYGTSSTGDSPEKVGDGAEWSVWYAQSIDAGTPGQAPTFSEVQATGTMHRGFVCTSGTGCAPGTRNLLDYFQLDIDGQGYANIAYTDDFNDKPGAPSNAAWVTFVQQDNGPGLRVPASAS